MKARGGGGILERNKSKRGIKSIKRKNLEYTTIGYKVVVTFIIIFRVCKREGV
jgi:hypothetical protein